MGINNKPFIYMIDSVGEHRGMHYYNFALVSALNKFGTNAILFTTPETASNPLCPDNVPIKGVFSNIYGDKPKWVRGLYYAISLLRIGLWAIKEKPDIAHLHFYQMPILDYLLLLWFQMLKVKSITTVHDVLPFNIGEDYTAARGTFMHRCYQESSGLILNSHHAKNCLAKLDSNLLKKSIVIPHGNYSSLDCTQLPSNEFAKKKISVQPDTRVILVFGTIKPNKRLDWIIQAMVKVTTNHPNTKLIIAGKPREQNMAEFLDLANKLGVSPNIIWHLEHVSDEELMNYFSAAEVVVFPYQWIYQSGALLMAMNFSKPIVATAVGSNIDTIQNNISGILVPPDDPESMAEAIHFILTDATKAEGYGKAAHDFVTSELSWDKIAKSTFQFYENY